MAFIFKERALTRRINAQGRIIHLLGTLHTQHVEFDPYSLWHIKALIQHLKPDLLLVESRPEELAKDNWGDGPIEMSFASLVALSLGMAVRGMDWWTKESLFMDLTIRDDHMVQNVIEMATGYHTLLVLTGMSHLKGFRRRLEGHGYVINKMRMSEKKILFDLSDVRQIFPPQMKHYLEKRIVLEQEALRIETDDHWRLRLQNVIEVRRQFLKIVEREGEE